MFGWLTRRDPEAAPDVVAMQLKIALLERKVAQLTGDLRAALNDAGRYQADALSTAKLD